MPVDQTWRVRQERMEWNEEMIEVEWKLENPREEPASTAIHLPRTTHGVTDTRTQDPSGGERAF